MRLFARGGPIALAVILMTVLIDFMGYLILLPVLPAHLESLGADPSDQGLIIGLYMFVLVLALPIWGWVADRVGRRPVLVVCLLGTTASFVLMGMAKDMDTFYAARVFQGLFGASIGTAQAYLSDVTHESQRARMYGLFGAVASLGMLTGPLLGGTLYSIDAELGTQLVFLAPAALAFVGFAAAALFLPESRRGDARRALWSDLFRSAVPAPLLILIGVHRPRILIYLYLFFHSFMSFGAVEAMFPHFASEIFGWTPLSVGGYLTFIGVVAGVTQGFLIEPLTRRGGELPLLTVGILTAAGAMIGLSFAKTTAGLFVFGLALAFGFGIVFPILTSLFSKLCGPDEIAAYHAHSQAMLNMGRGVGAYAGGIVATQLGAPAPLLIAGLALLGGFFLLLFLVPSLRDDARAEVSTASGARIP
jgi:MFS family permease